MSTIQAEHLLRALTLTLGEAFEQVQGMFLDKGTSLFETLAGISAAEASIPVGGKCATLAAQVSHVAFYLDAVDRTVRDPSTPSVDWNHIWNTVSAVSPEEWAAIQAGLRANYARILTLLRETPFSDERQIAGAIGVVAHTAYHLGEIRQALCTLR